MNFASILTATHAAVITGADTTTAARAAFPVMVKAGANIAQLIRAIVEGEGVKSAVDAATLTAGAGIRASLVEQGIDADNRKTVANALRSHVWADAGHTMPEAGAAKPEDGTEARKVYDRMAQRLSRIVTLVVGKAAGVAEAGNTVEVKVPRALAAAMKALVAEHGKAGRKVLNKALADALAAAK